MKNLLITTVLLSAALSANAQLRVSSNGQVTVGKSTSNGAIHSNSNIQGVGTIVLPGIDTTSNLKIMGDFSGGHGGTISFGNSQHVYIKEIYDGLMSSFNRNGILELGGLGGFTYKCANTRILEYNPATLILGNGAPFVIKATVSAPQYLTTSDATLKTKVEPLENMGSLLDGITPVSYFLKSDRTDDSKESNPSSKYEGETHPQYGFIAQEVKEIIPDLVYQDSDGLLSIDYIGFIPLLVDAIKDMKTTIQEQQAEIENLKNPIQKKDTDEESGSIVASLSQNKPNPFKVTTSIGCVIPESVNSAFICVYDLNGSQKLRRDIKQRGNIDVTIEGNTLTAGMYIYTLVCDGIEIDSKRMILTD